MITGYNTDVRHNEVVFHVQTEDKGLANPFIESLVYVGGQVLASKRASYAELLAEGKEEKDIVALMDHQHRTMIAAIRARQARREAGRRSWRAPDRPDPEARAAASAAATPRPRWPSVAPPPSGRASGGAGRRGPVEAAAAPAPGRPGSARSTR